MNPNLKKRIALMMVSGGSDSVAMLEMAHAFVSQGDAADDLVSAFAESFGDPTAYELRVLHVNHMLRGDDSDEDERFVLDLCERLGIPCKVVRIDIDRICQEKKGGMEAIAREQRYEQARIALDEAVAETHAQDGIICTAHTLDDRVETFFMRALVGTGPGGLASIPRKRGDIVRPLLSITREQLRDWLRRTHPSEDDATLWREDETNYDGANFRSRVRRDLMPALRGIRPGFESALEQTMDLMADEDRDLQQQADSLVYRSLAWDGTEARLPVSVLEGRSRPMARRVLRTCLLVAKPSSRLEAAQIERVLDHLDDDAYATEASGGLRVRIDGKNLMITTV